MRLFKLLVLLAVAFAVAFPLASYMGQWMQGDAGEYHYVGVVTGLSNYEDQNGEYLLIEIDKPAVFCEEQNECDDDLRTGFAVQNADASLMHLGQEVTINCYVKPISWIPRLNYDRVSCELVK